MATRTTIPPSRRRRRSAYRRNPIAITPRRVALVAALCVVGLGGVYVGRVAFGLAKIFHTDPITALTHALGSGGDSPISNFNRINVALYGYGGPQHDGPYLTDSIMVLSIQAHHDGPSQVTEVSVPRDWYVPIDLGGGRTVQGRINEAYSDGVSGSPAASSVYSGSQGGGALANNELSKLLGIRIDYYVGVDFNAFQQAVDSVGGIEVNVPTGFTDREYPRGDCDSNGHGDCGIETVHFDAGQQRMDGATALIYTRSRHGSNGEDSDFARSKRQQLVLAALKQKVVRVGGLANLPDLLSKLGDNVSTNLSIDDAKALYTIVKDVDQSKIGHVSLDNTNFLADCGYPRNCDAAYLVARDRSFESLHRYMGNLLPDPHVVGEQAAVTFENGASNVDDGASARWAQLFGALGFRTDDAGDVRRSSTTHVIDTSGGRSTATAQWFASYFGVQLETPATPAAPAGNVVDRVPPPTPTPSPPPPPGVTVIIGQDAENAFHNQHQGSVFGSLAAPGGGAVPAAAVLAQPDSLPARIAPRQDGAVTAAAAAG